MSGTRLIVGCMSGTSMDAIDAALVAVNGTGLSMHASLERAATAPLPHRDRLRAFADGEAFTARELRAIAVDLGAAHRDLVGLLIGAEVPELIVMHGQTVLHDPPLSWQLLDPWPVAMAFGCRVVTDLRSRSLASGGQGAPLTPLADWVLFRGDRPRSIVNLGGFANITTLPAESGNATADIDRMGGGDVCPCNLVLDRLARGRLGKPFDENGAAALAGTPDDAIADHLASRLFAPAGRSLGTGDEATRLDDATAKLTPSDALATACDAIGRAIARSSPPGDVVLAGGGTLNLALVRAIERHLGRAVRTSDRLGVPIQSREAVGFAVLGALADDGIPVSLPKIAGSATQGRDGQWILP